VDVDDDSFEFFQYPLAGNIDYVDSGVQLVHGHADPPVDSKVHFTIVQPIPTTLVEDISADSLEQEPYAPTNKIERFLVYFNDALGITAHNKLCFYHHGLKRIMDPLHPFRFDVQHSNALLEAWMYECDVSYDSEEDSVMQDAEVREYVPLTVSDPYLVGVEKNPGPSTVGSKRKTVRGRRRMRSRRVQKNNTDPALILRPLYKRQPCGVFKIAGTPIISTTTVTTGLVATSVTLSAAQILNFTTRCQDMWDQYRIIKAVAHFTCFSSSCTGQMNVWYTEESTTVPSNAASQQAGNALRFNLSSIDRIHSKSYVPHDPARQEWSDTNGITLPIGYLKIYTDTANNGAPITITTCMSTQIVYTVQFRGFTTV
jgi:hypothetical protein